MVNKKTHQKIAELADPAKRLEASLQLARQYHADHLIIFVRDDTGNFLPAPEYPKTLPEGLCWKEHLRSIQDRESASTELLCPFTKKRIRARSFRQGDFIVTFLGDKLKNEDAKELVLLLPLIGSALLREVMMIRFHAELYMENQIARATRELSISLEDARQALEIELKKSKSILDSINEAFFSLNKNFEFTDLNPLGERLLKKKKEDVLGKIIWSYYPDFNQSIYEKEYRKAMESQKPRRFEVFSTTQDKWFEVRVYPSAEGLAIFLADISERKTSAEVLATTAEELRSQSALLEAVLQQMPEGVLVADREGKLILRNRQIEIMLGGFLPCDSINDYGHYKGFRLDGTPYRPEEWPLSRSLLNGEVIQGELIELERISGGRAILSISSAPIRNSGGDIVAGVVIHHDITTQIDTEAKLRYQNDLTRIITDNAASCLFMMDKKGHPTFMNPAAKKVTGYDSLEEIKHRPLHYAVHWKRPDGSHYPMEDCPIDNAQAELKSVKNAEEIFCDKHGRLFPVSYSIAPLEKDGEVVGSVLEFREITQEKRIQTELLRLLDDQKKYIELLNIINSVGKSVAAELDLEKLVQQVTDYGTRLTGAQFGAFFYNAQDNEGKKLLLNVVSGASKEAFSQFPNPRATAVFYPTFMGEGTIRSDDITKDPRYGKNAPYSGYPSGHLPMRSYLAVSVISQSGEVIGGLFFGHEEPGMFTKHSEVIAEGLASQAAIAMDNAQLYKKAQEAVQMRDEFLSIASHELKTPLTSLKLQTQLRQARLKRGDNFDTDELQKMFLTDDRQVVRLSRLIDDMLDISRISTGKLSLQPEKIELCQLLHEVVEKHSPQIEKLGVDVTIECPADIVGVWDRLRLEQVVTNLLTNALRYGNQKPVHISVSEQNSEVIVKVVDQGIGISEENIQRIFERFERAISSDNVSGLGLGLYIVREIIRMHGGRIWVESVLNEGSCFSFTLPKV